MTFALATILADVCDVALLINILVSLPKSTGRNLLPMHISNNVYTSTYSGSDSRKLTPDGVTTFIIISLVPAEEGNIAMLPSSAGN